MATENEITNSYVYVGYVKWYRVKSGYGFIHILSPNAPNGLKDLFVHHSALVVKNPQYNFLVQGEYVEFKLIDATNSHGDIANNHIYQASNVTGILGGKLFCDGGFFNSGNSPISYQQNEANTFVKSKLNKIKIK